jgi:hypothetical protein
MRTAADFWANLELNPPSRTALLAEKHDLTRDTAQITTSIVALEKIMGSLSGSGSKLLLAGMYLQGSLTTDARKAFQELLGEIHLREIAKSNPKAPHRRVKSLARIARGL